MDYRSIAVSGVLVALMMVGTMPAGAQTAPRTPWGQPDLQGVWDFRTITPLQRPTSAADQEFLSAEEVANLERATVDRNAELASRESRRTEATRSVDQGEEGAPGFYNNFWLDTGLRTVGTRRTSLVIDPLNGRLPALTPVGQDRTTMSDHTRASRPLARQPG